MNTKNTYEAVLSGRSDHNIKFIDLQNLIVSLDFIFKRQRGSHMIYYNEDIGEIINIQHDGSKAKSYEVLQVRKLIVKYDLKIK